MIRDKLLMATAFALLLIFIDTSHSIDFKNLHDQTNYRCSGGIVSIGDMDRDVQEKCGDPLEIGRRQDFGPIWIYHEGQENFMYYLAFLNGRLQRIVGSPCSPDDASCFDLR